LKKIYRKSTLIKKCLELGFTNVEITYSKNEGFWLCCDQYDDWLSMYSYGAFIKINKIYENKNNNRFFKTKWFRNV